MVFVRIRAQRKAAEKPISGATVGDICDITYLALPLPAGHARAGDAASLPAGLVLVGALLPPPTLLHQRRLSCAASQRAPRRSGGFHGRAAFERASGSSGWNTHTDTERTEHTSTQAHRHHCGVSDGGGNARTLLYSSRTRNKGGLCARELSALINQRTRGYCCRRAVGRGSPAAAPVHMATYPPTHLAS